MEFSSKAEAETALDYLENLLGSSDFRVMLVGDAKAPGWRLKVWLDRDSASTSANRLTDLHVQQIF
jgi:hypothetical protein